MHEPSFDSLPMLDADETNDIPQEQMLHRRDTSCSGRLLVAVNDTAAVEIVRAELDRDTVAGEDADEVLAHAS